MKGDETRINRRNKENQNGSILVMAVFLPAIINSVLGKGDSSMARPAFTEAQIIQKTLENVRSFTIASRR